MRKIPKTTFTKRATVRLTENDYLALVNTSEKFGISLADLIRKILLNKQIKEPEATKYDYKLINQLRQLGGLLKKYYTDTQGANSRQTKEILRNIDQVIKNLLSEVSD